MQYEIYNYLHPCPLLCRVPRCLFDELAEEFILQFRVPQAAAENGLSHVDMFIYLGGLYGNVGETMARLKYSKQVFNSLPLHIFCYRVHLKNY